MKIKIQLPRYKMSLSCEQFDRLFATDIQTVQRRLPYRQEAVHRKVLKSTTFPMNIILRENIGKEEYRGYMEVKNKRQMFTEGLDITSVVFFKNSRGMCAYTNLDPFGVVGDRYTYVSKGKFRSSHRYLFTPHFFERYEMRHGWEGDNSDIHNQFFLRNITSEGTAFNTAFCKSRPDDYKTIDVWSLCEDGLMLGQVMGDEEKARNGEPYIIQINTFLDIETLTKRQDKYRGLLEEMKSFYSSTEHIESIGSLNKRTFITNIKKL